MKQTRREFVVTGALAVGAAVVARPAQTAEPLVPHEMFVGDLYLAEHGLGGRSFDEAREHAVRHRNLESRNGRS